MNIYGFITLDETNDLPEDSRVAFAKFVEIAYQRFSGYVQQYESQEAWNSLEDLRHSFMNVTLAAASQYNISEFVRYTLPSADNFDLSNFRDYIATLDHFTTQIAIDNSRRSRKESIGITEPVRDKIRSYCYHLREFIENSDIPEPKRSSLLQRLNDFEQELQKKRLSLLSVAALAIYIATIPGGVGGTVEVANRVLSQILSVVGEAKELEDQLRKLPPTAPPAALSPPRKSEPAPSKYAADLDDDLPF